MAALVMVMKSVIKGKTVNKEVADAAVAAGVNAQKSNLSMMWPKLIEGLADLPFRAPTVSEVSAAGVGLFLFLSCTKIASKRSMLTIW